MEITKQNETFNLSDKTEQGWIVTGSATSNTDGMLSVNFNVNLEDGLTDNIGYYSVTVPNEGMINLSISTLPKYYDSFIDYSQQVLQLVQDYLKNQTSASVNQETTTADN